MDMGLSILDDDMGVPKWALDMNLPVHGEAVAVCVCFSLHLHVSASAAQRPAADGKNGQNTQEKDETVSDQAEVAAVHGRQCSVDGMGYQDKVGYM